MPSSPADTPPLFDREIMREAWLSDHTNAKLQNRESDDEEPGQLEKSRLIDGYIQECRRLYRDPLINERTRHEYDKMWEELRAEGDVKKMQENVRFMTETIAAAKEYKEAFKSQLDEAVENKWIGKKTRDNWWKRFNNSNLLEWDRKKWIMDEFPQYMQGWKEVAKMRHKVRALAKKLNVKENDVRELKGMYKIQEFLALQFDDRKHKVNAAMAALLAIEKKQKDFYKYLEGELKLAVRNGSLHKSKVGPWLKRVMEAEDPYAFRQQILLPFMENWEKASTRYDDLHEEMKNGVMPRGLRTLSKDAFLLLTYEQRQSYLREVELRLKEITAEPEEEKDQRLDAFKKNIRHNLDTRDWEGAEEALNTARKLYPQDEDLESMADFLQSHRPAVAVRAETEDDSPDAQKTLEEMRAIIGMLPSDLQWLYIEAMQDGPAVFNRLLQLVYNRVWVYEHHYSNEQLDREHAESEVNKMQTQHYIENGHSKQLERNIIDGDTANSSAIRDDCTRAQVLYMGKTGRDDVLHKIRQNKDNEKFGYWTTLVPNDVSYAVHRMIVKNYNYKLKSGMRTLDKQGYRFTLTGSARKKDGSFVQRPQKHEHAAETSYAMAG